MRDGFRVRERERDKDIVITNIFGEILSSAGLPRALFNPLLRKGQVQSAFTYARTRIKGAGIIYIYSGDSMSICFYPPRPRPSLFTRRPKLNPFPRQRASSPNRAFSQSGSFPLRLLHRAYSPAVSLTPALLPCVFSVALSPTRARERARSGADGLRESFIEPALLSRYR